MNVGKNWTLQMSIPQYLVLVLKLTPINTVSLNTVHIFNSPKSVLSGKYLKQTRPQDLNKKKNLTSSQNQVWLISPNTTKHSAGVTSEISQSFSRYHIPHLEIKTVSSKEVHVRSGVSCTTQPHCLFRNELLCQLLGGLRQQ